MSWFYSCTSSTTAVVSSEVYITCLHDTCTCMILEYHTGYIRQEQQYSAGLVLLLYDTGTQSTQQQQQAQPYHEYARGGTAAVVMMQHVYYSDGNINIEWRLEF